MMLVFFLCQRMCRQINVYALGTPEHDLLSDIIDDRRRIKDVKQLSPLGQTSALESFHAVINHFAPKMIHFHYNGMYTRY